jgi:glycosyltransferase involved in cell wall biosynthesis
MPHIKSTPILSLCIPTYNRGMLLDNLLRQISTMSDTTKSKIQICISDNFSSDITQSVITEWNSKLDILSIRQQSNIGLSRNFQAVALLATGKWIMVIGDDDEFYLENFLILLEMLSTISNTKWVLVGVSDTSNNEHLLDGLQTGSYTARAFKRIILQSGLYPYGFIGMHVFPSKLQAELAALSFEQTQPWPHLALLLRQLNVGQIQVLVKPIIKQAGGGSVLFWQIGDWVEISLRKLNIIAHSRLANMRHQYFYNALMLRELYSFRNAKTVALWKALEPLDCCQKIFSTFMPRYELLGWTALFAVLHIVFIFFIYLVPSLAIRQVMKLLGREKVITNYFNNTKTQGTFDGVKRGL